MSQYHDVDTPSRDESSADSSFTDNEQRHQRAVAHILDEEIKHSSRQHKVNPADRDVENPSDIIVDIEHIPKKYIWRSCCLILDSRAVLFFSQLSISVIIMIFCIRQMVVLEDTDAQKNYGILLSFIIGIWFPAPKIGT